MATTFEKTWQLSANQTLSITDQNQALHNIIWWFKSFTCGQLATSAYKDGYGVALTTYQGLWTCYYSCDGTTVGTAGDGVDRWGTQGATTGTTGAASSLVSGATITGAIRITGVTGLGSAIGNFLTITGASTSANNSPTNTPFKIVKVNSSTDVEIYNPNGVTGDAFNGAISWSERTNFTFNNTTVVNSAGAHSWFVIKSPAALGPYYIILDLNSATAGVCSISMSKTSPTGGTTSARPTSTDEVQLSGWSSINFFNQTPTATIQTRAHGGLATDGNFHVISSADTASWIGMIMFSIPAETKTGDAYKALMFASGTQSVSLVGNLQTTTKVGSKNFNGLITLSPQACSWFGNAGGSQRYFNNQMSTTDYTDSLYGDLPIYWYIATAGYKTMKGRWVDYRLCPEGLAQGTVESTQASPTSMVVGGIWVPCYIIPII